MLLLYPLSGLPRVIGSLLGGDGEDSTPTLYYRSLRLEESMGVWINSEKRTEGKTGKERRVECPASRDYASLTGCDD